MTDDHYPKPYMNYDSSIIIVGVGRKNGPIFIEIFSAIRVLYSAGM